MNRPTVIANNLRHYRTMRGFTQKQLAELIGYTEKSVSKWESGHGLPTVEMLIKLANLFDISLDELVFEHTASHYFLGIDGGGTKTVFLLTDENGTVLNRICKGPSNPNDIGMENATAVLKEGINEICKGIPYSRITMFAGLSGGGMTGDNAKILRRFFSKFGFYAFDNGSDVENLIALAGHKKCILVIMGTGFIVYSLNGAYRKRISGWGMLFDAGGSGFTLGRDAITAALRASDGSGEPTLLSKLIEDRLGETAESHLARFYDGGKKYIAEFADLVFQASGLGDKTACDILEKNMAFVAQMINTAVSDLIENSGETGKEIPVLFSGGIGSMQDVLFPLIDKHITGAKVSLQRLENEQVMGAQLRAMSLFEEKRKEKK